MRLTRESFLREHTALKYVPNKPIYLNYNKSDTKTVEELLNKLGQLEDIEDELGIDLIILFKMIRDGFYIKTSDDILFFKNEDKYEMLKKYKDFTNDYGKTWALTKEELE